MNAHYFLEGAFMGLIFVAIGLGLVAIWFVMRKKAQASQAWPSAQGTVISSELSRIRDTDGQWTERPRVVYEYVVAGASLRGNRVSFGGSSNVGARKCVERYPAGKPVEVFYDPAAPASSVLERKTGGGAFVLPLVGGIFAIICILLLVKR